MKGISMDELQELDIHLPSIGDTPVINVSGNLSPREQWNQYAVVLAEALGLPISFRYVKSAIHDPSPRRLDNVEVKVNSFRDLLVVGTDPDRLDQIRSFRVDRITDYITIDR
jgi:hypothetical protein